MSICNRLRRHTHIREPSIWLHMRGDKTAIPEYGSETGYTTPNATRCTMRNQICIYYTHTQSGVRRAHSALRSYDEWEAGVPCVRGSFRMTLESGLKEIRATKNVVDGFCPLRHRTGDDGEDDDWYIKCRRHKSNLKIEIDLSLEAQSTAHLRALEYQTRITNDCEYVWRCARTSSAHDEMIFALLTRNSCIMDAHGQNHRKRYRCQKILYTI